jgi:curved DNA-binding protein CbpA
MGANQSIQIDPSHIRIYENLKTIQNPAVKIQMIQTILAGPEYVQSAKRAGIYSDLLSYIATHTNNQPSASKIIITQPIKRNNIERVGKANSDEKAIGYFQACLEVLGLQEEVALTEESLKSAYKKSVLKNHPDKGGSEKAFEKVTRAYAYLGEILRRIHGGRSTTVNVDEPTVLKDSRAKDYESVKHVEPVRLNPKKLDVNAFNKMFEETRIPDPEEDGYGDWLKDPNEKSGGKQFTGKFNRDVFNQAFEDEAKGLAKEQNYIIHQPQSMIMAPTLGVELGRDKPSSYTAAYNADLNFTDLKQAYTTESSFSQQIASVRVDNRNFEQYKDDRGKAPRPLTNSEMEEVQRAEEYMKKKEEQRRLRAAQEEMNASSYFERMKRLVITDTSTKK